MTRAVLSPAAERDILGIVAWIASENPAAARSFREALSTLATAMTRLIRSMSGRYRDLGEIGAAPMVDRLPEDAVRPAGDDEVAAEEQAFKRAVDAGLADIEAGREVSLADVKAKLGLG